MSRLLQLPDEPGLIAAGVALLLAAVIWGVAFLAARWAAPVLAVGPSRRPRLAT